MKRELKRPKVVLALLVALASVLSAVMGVPALAQPTFSGNVEADFLDADPSILIFTDPGGKDLLVLNHTTPGTSSGWDIKDVRLAYDSITDTLYVGLNSYETVGDADTDGNEAGMTYDSGTDVLNLGVGESVAVYFDLDRDTNWDVIAGVPDTADFSGFTVKAAIGTTPTIAFFGANLATGYDHVDPTPYWTPASAPDLEFRILNFSRLPNHGGELGVFTIGAYMGSWADVSIKEDTLVGSASPAINIVKKTNGTDNNSGPGPYVPVNGTVTWTYNVTNIGSENLTSIAVTDSQAGVNPVYVTGDDGDNILETTEAWIYQATGPATVGQHSNIGTATGYFGGIPVSDTDPDNYLGVRAKMEISPHLESNKVGEEHVLTACVYVDTGSGYALYAQPITINFFKVGVGNLSATSVPTTTGCAQTILTSNTTGTSNVTAQCIFAVGGASFNISTDGIGDNSRTAEKIWEAQAGIDIEKYVSVDGGMTWGPADSAPGPSAVVGKNVSFKVVVCNNGTEPLANISVGDTDFTFTGVITSLVAGACDESDVLIVAAVAGQQYDLATVNATADGVPVTDNDPAYYTGLTPGIDIEKYVSVDGGTIWDPADSAPGPSAVVGKNISFKVRVCNNGTAPLTNISVGDTDFTFTGVATSLVAGACDESDVLIVAAVAGQQYDLATVNATADGVPVTDNDPAYYLGGNSAIDLIKYVSVNNQTSWDDANSAPGPSIVTSKGVYFKFRIENTGNVTLTGITLTDTVYNLVGITPALPAWLAAGAVYEGVIGPIAATAGNHTNTGNATGYWGGNPVSDTDPANYFGFVNCIHIEKSTNGADADSPTGPSIPVGGAVTWVYNITNCGSLNLTNIVVTDDNGTPLNLADDWHPAYISGDTGQPGVLEPYSQTHEAWMYQASGNATAGYYANIGYVTGTTQAGDAAGTASDPSHYYNRPTTVGWETYPVNKVRVLLPWIALLAAITVGASLLVLRRRRLIQKT